MNPTDATLASLSVIASKMAVSKAPKTYMTHKLDQRHFIFDFLWMFRSNIIRKIKMENCFD